SWVVSDEAFYPRSIPVGNLKLRFAYGASGQQPATTAALLFYTGQTATVLSGAAPADQPGIDLTAFGNNNLKPERSAEFEGGFDAGLFRDAVRLEVTYYDKKTHDALVNRQLPPSNGINQNRFENIGSVQNRGIEALLSVTKDVAPGVGVDASLSFARNTNKLLTLGVPPIVNAEITLFPSRVRLGGQLDYRGDWKAYNFTERFRCVGVAFNCSAVNNPQAPLPEQARAVAAGSSSLGFSQAGYVVDGTFLKPRE